MVPGAPADDAPVRGGWLLERLGTRFTLLLFSDGDVSPELRAELVRLAQAAVPVHAIVVQPAGTARLVGLDAVEDSQGLVARRYDARPGTSYLLRPDQHVAARWRNFDAAAVRAALARATCNP